VDDRGRLNGLIPKKVSLLACGRADDQKGDEEEGLEMLKETEQGELMRDAGRAAVRGQNWRDRTSVFFAASSS
jgi:hypothetical protein